MLQMVAGFKQYKAGETVDISGELAEWLISRKYAVYVNVTTETVKVKAVHEDIKPMQPDQPLQLKKRGPKPKG